MTLVEEAEQNGFRSRGFIGSIIDRLTGSAKVGGVGVEVPSRKRPTVTSVSGAVRRRAKDVPGVWLLIDDLDKNFENTRLQRIKIASFFDAVREMNRAVPELRIRAAIRPNVWTTIKMEFESLSHVEQYVHDLRWTEDDSRRLVARRIEGYLRRNNMWEAAESSISEYGADKEKALISLAFESPMRWGGGVRPPHVIVFTLSMHRPRWMIELCKVAATRAERSKHSRIMHDDLTGDLSEFGNRRIQDTVAEFKSQCGQIEELISAFAREPEQLTTSQLLQLIENKILTHLEPRIAGVPGQPKAVHVAAFLYEIGFFFGRRDYLNGTYQHVTYADLPSVFRSRSDPDAGLTWEIHPVFRQRLEMRDSIGKEVRPQRAPHRRRGRRR